MKIVGLLPVRNEDWVLSMSARAALMWCDSLVILLHACTDKSEAIARGLQHEHPARITLLSESGDGWDEMQHRQKLLDAAREEGATHIAIIDADEILTGNLLSTIRGHIERTPGHSILQLPGYNLRHGCRQYHTTGIWGNRWFSVVFADDSRLHWSGDRFHHREPMGPPLSRYAPVRQGNGGILHLWGADERRLRAKHAAYKMTETLRWPNKSRAEIDRTYQQAFDPAANHQFDQNWRFGAVPEEWWQPYIHLQQYLRLDATPWQEGYCQKLLEQHGAARFIGLNLLGVCEKVTA